MKEVFSVKKFNMRLICSFLKTYPKISSVLKNRCMSLSSTTVDFKTECVEKKDTLHHFDIDYYCNHDNKLEIEENIKKRKCGSNINEILRLNDQLSRCENGSDACINLKNKLFIELSKLPNKLHDDIKHLEEPSLIRNVGVKQEHNFKPKEFTDIAKQLRIARNENISKFTDHRSYFFLGQLAEMETALIHFTLKYLLSKKFHLISVPDILDKSIIESSGMETEGERTQVYSLDENYYGKGLCLSGTSEMAIAGYLKNKTFFHSELPVRLAAVSRCYRAETSRTSEERGIFRVHQFTKVEMFGVSSPENSSDLLEEFREIQESLFGMLGLCLQTLDMPPCDLGNQASRKYDIEAWMPGRKMYGEVSSCSNCTDYQSRRLNIKMDNVFAHTLNGTACAVPRLLIAILETYQNKDGTVSIPDVLQPYMNGQTLITNNKNVPKMKSYKLMK